MRILFTVLALASFLGSKSLAAVCSRTLTFADGVVLSASQLNGEFNAITNCANSIDDANVSSSAAILPSKLSATIAGDGLGRDGSTGVLSVNTDGSTIEISSDAVRIKDLGVSAAKLSTDSVTTAKILNSNVTTAKIADGAVTTAKLGSLGQQISSSSGSFSTSSTSLVDVTNLSVTITSYGRPIFIGFVSSATDVNTTTGFYSNCYLQLVRGSTNINATGSSISVPIGSFFFIDPQNAGTYTYKLQAQRIVAGSCGIDSAKMVAYEL